jgi:hypothetical protein
MIVIGTDTHKATHTCGAVFAETGQLAGERTAPAREPGFRELLAWGRDLDSERIWAIEGCRHVSGSLERFLVASGEQVVPDLELPAGCLDRARWLDRVARKLARAEQSARVRISRELVRAIRNRTRRASELEREIGALVPSSGARTRFRLERGGNRQLNCALHRIAVTQGRVHPPARDYLARKQAEGKSRIEAMRCLKRHLARRVWRLLIMIKSEIDLSMSNPVNPQRGSLTPQIAAVA